MVADAKLTDIYVLNAHGGAPRRATDGIGDNIYTAFSRDGNWLYFTSSRTGRDEIHRINLESHVAEQVTRQGALNAEESLDGRRLIFQKADTGGGNPPRELLEIGVDGQHERPLGLTVAYGTFALVPGGILHVPWSDYGKRESMMKLYDFDTGTTKDVRAIRGPVLGLTSKNPDAVLFTLSSTKFDLVRVDDFR